MAPPLFRDIGFPINKPEHWQEETEEGDNQSLEKITSRELTNRKLIPKVLFQIKLKPEVQPRDWTDVEKVIQIHKQLKKLLTWILDKHFSLGQYHGQKWE
ncbi:hypothetical protein O181_016637 [Austropuccinia psidii MF-1]|uniref:Uncharacterized protein n=1 Tax=Austropuccinia psidii MF-1 TaxID=1389203 RepID=A0A9Q3GRV6_9BASI|nr:hypothetical protein [Austropuccinia psidii MF-1]